MSQRERAATRDALLDVARILVERDGEPALTLGAVADEAGLARATIYGFFAGRRELLDALDPSKPMPVFEEPAPAPAEEDDGSAAIWMNYQPNLSEFLPETVALEEEAVQPQVAEPVEAPAQPDADAEGWIVYQASPVPETFAVAVSDAVEQTVVVDEAAQDAPLDVAHAASAEPVGAPTDAVESVAVESSQAEAGDEPASEAEAVVQEHGEAAPELNAREAATAAATEQEQIVEAQVSPPEMQSGPVEEPRGPEAQTDEDESEFASPRDERRRVQAAHLEGIARRLILPESALKDGTDAVIARLDVRIRVLEKSIAGLETRHGAAETDSNRKLKPVTDMVEQLHARAGVADGRVLQTVSELRLSIHQLETRLDALEGPQRGAISGALSWPEPVPQSEAPEAESRSPETPDGFEPEGADGTADNPKHAYLSTVRTLAKEGARQAAERETQHEVERQTRRRRMIAAACVAVLCLGALGVLFVFHPGSHGVSAAQSKPNPAPVASHSSKQSAFAPLDRLTALAESGNVTAELLVGLKYLESNDAQAARWLERAAGNGNAVAQNALGTLYQNGRGVKADLTRAQHLYEQAAAQGNRHAMSNLASLYAGAGGTDKNFAEAARWFQRSAGLGYVDAQFNLAVLYERGDGVPQSLLDAYKWYTVAAFSGDTVAKTRADAIATQLSPDELAAAQRAVAEFKPAPLNKAVNDVPTMSDVLAAR